jgi:L-2-hydroxyglutarate oxidase
MLHVCNAPSPAATSAIPIGEMIADEWLDRVRNPITLSKQFQQGFSPN